MGGECGNLSCRIFRSVKKIVFTEAVVGQGASGSFRAEDNVVKERNAHQLSALGNGLGQLRVGVAGCGVTAGMVVSHDDACSVGDECRAKDGTRVCRDGGESASGNKASANELFATVQHEKYQIFFGLIPQIADEVVIHGTRTAHFSAFQIFFHRSLSQFKGRRQGGGFGGADALAAFHDFPRIHGTQISKRACCFLDECGQFQHGASLQTCV